MSSVNTLNTFQSLATQLVQDFANSRPLYANSLIVSIYGDMICPYGGTIWLGSLIKLLEPLGVNQRLVRTSVFRLAEKGILQATQHGRRSYYTFTEQGFRQFQSAAQRIYAAPDQAWDGQWRIVISHLGQLNNAQREVLRKELIWLGFSRLSAGLYAHPSIDLEQVSLSLQKHGLAQDVVLLSAQAQDLPSAISNQLIVNGFNAHDLDQAYLAFIDTFQPILQAAQSHQTPLAAQYCFSVRLLLIHRYRYLLLHQAELPSALLAADAPRQRARRLTQQLYAYLKVSADQYFLQSTALSGLNSTQTSSHPPLEYAYRFVMSEK